MRIVAAVDGSCIGHPGPGGWAWVTANGTHASQGARRTTNNRMEPRSGPRAPSLNVAGGYATARGCVTSMR